MPSKAICAAVPRSTPTNGDETKEAEEKKKKEAEEKAARDLQTRKRLQTFLDVSFRVGRRRLDERKVVHVRQFMI